MTPPAPSQTATPPTPAEVAVELLRAGNYEAAAAVYRRLVAAEPSEPEHVRRLALALLGAGRADRAAAEMERAYLADPQLAVDSLIGFGLVSSPSELRRLLDRAVDEAQRSRSAQAWLLVGVLMQSEGRPVPAVKMIDRAASLGLSPAVVKAMRDELSPAPKRVI